MEFTELSAMLPTAGAIITIGTAYLTIRKISKDAEKSKKEQAALILQEAKEEDAALYLKLDNKINELELKLENLEDSVEKDLKYLKESYSADLKNLSEKIENLRSDLSAQHSALLALLTKLIENQ